MNLSNKVGIVTGAARGIGRACAQRLADDGASVLMTDVLDDDGAQVAASIRERGGIAVFQHLDVSDEDSWEGAVGRAMAEVGAVHVLVNNAGIGDRTTSSTRPSRAGSG